MGKGLFGPNGAGLGAALGGLLGGAQGGGATGQGTGQPGQLGGNLGETLGNLLQQGLGGLNAAPQQQQSQPPRVGSTREIRGRSIPSPGSQDAAPPPAQTTPEPAPAPAQNEPPQDSQAMNEVLRQLFNR
jgi:AsmA protein